MKNKFGSVIYIDVYLYHQNGAMLRRVKIQKKMEDDSAKIVERTENEQFNDFQVTTWEENPNRNTTDEQAARREDEAVRYGHEMLHAHENATRK
jgi:hypothetical protein